MRVRLVPPLLHLAAVTWLSLTVGFVGLHLVPGSPVEVMVEKGARDAATRTALRARYGLDRPLAEQYGRYLLRTAQGELGTSLATGAPVAPALRDAVGRTLLLSGAGVLGALLVGTMVGAVAGWRPQARLAQAAHQLLLAGYAIPEFLVALGFLWLLALHARWLPVGGLEDPIVALTGTAWERWRDRLYHLLLPALTLATGWAAAFARQQQGAVAARRTALAVQAARARGLGEGRLFFNHLLRPTLATPATLLAVLAPALAGGALVVETVFAWPGVGTLLVRAIQARDYPVASAAAMATGCVVAVITLVMEWGALLLDPQGRPQDGDGA